MVNLVLLGVVILSGLAVGIADALIKKAAEGVSFWQAMTSPLMLGIAGLYALQVSLFAYAFVRKWNLGIVGILTFACYTLTVMLAALFIFNEKLSIIQSVGIAFTVFGILLLSL